ncbi:hypothetical protein EDD85DRAFT_310560 [Armillaria nabsnona]|nr:hypothetical protein EDD85DRAFT_310560 [Armillaria nabsnona]
MKESFSWQSISLSGSAAPWRKRQSIWDWTTTRPRPRNDPESLGRWDFGSQTDECYLNFTFIHRLDDHTSGARASKLQALVGFLIAHTSERTTRNSIIWTWTSSCCASLEALLFLCKARTMPLAVFFYRRVELPAAWINTQYFSSSSICHCGHCKDGNNLNSYLMGLKCVTAQTCQNLWSHDFKNISHSVALESHMILSTSDLLKSVPSLKMGIIR